MFMLVIITAIEIWRDSGGKKRQWECGFACARIPASQNQFIYETVSIQNEEI